MKKMLTIAEGKEINEEERSIVGWGSRAVVDRDNELIQGEGWDLKAFRKNPVLMLSHDYSTLPVGKVLWVKDTSDGLKFKAQFASTETANEVFQLYREDIMHAFSVGFIPKEWEDAEDEKAANKPKRIYTKAELLEISCVSIPACPDALIEAYNTGQIKTKEFGKVINDIEEKALPGSKTLPLNADRPWDASGAETRMRNAAGGPDKDKINWATYRKGFAWYDAKDAENYGAYKLPFADVLDGKLTAIWRGIAAGMAALLGARGGVNIPDTERKSVYNFLVSYYKRFEKEPPDFKDYTEEELKELFEEKKEQFTCECIKCGWKNTSTKHCDAHKCEKCGGEMRRIERPGPGKQMDTDVIIYFGEKYAELKTELAQLKEGRVLSSKNRKLVNDCIKQMQTAITELQKLIDATEPEPKDVKEDNLDLTGLNLDEYKKSKEFNPDEDDIKRAIQAAFKEAAGGLNFNIRELVEEGIKRAQGKIS